MIKVTFSVTVWTFPVFEITGNSSDEVQRELSLQVENFCKSLPGHDWKITSEYWVAE